MSAIVLPMLFETVRRWEVADGPYRYELGREWDTRRPALLWIMLNPSVASDVVDDPTVLRCMKWSNRWEFGACVIANLYAYRATHPRDLRAAAWPVGPNNATTLARLASEVPDVVCAWGAGAQPGRVATVLELLAQQGRTPTVLGLSPNGAPCHPLARQRFSGMREPWKVAA